MSALHSTDHSALPKSLDTDPADRRLDRILAVLGLLDDAAPLFRSGVRVPRAGVLLALPALIESGVFDCAKRVYGSIGPAFYGLRTTVVALLLMALLRIKRAEALKEPCPADLGRVLGLDRAPEVTTLRRKLSRLAVLGRATLLGRALAERRVAARGSVLGFLYVDGHVRVHHGKRTIPKTHVARMRLPMPATSDYWVNDAKGEPLFVVTAEANTAMVKMLPLVLAELRPLLGDRRATIVFDRGGFSPKLFLQLIDDGFDILTYRKGRIPRVPKRRFRRLSKRIDGRTVRYVLADQEVRLLAGRLRLRQVTRLNDNGHQVSILTSRRDLPAVEVAFRMFERWRQENFFKYLREEYALDVLVDYQIEPDDPQREVPNPAWKAADTKLRKARAELAKLHTYYGLQALTDPKIVASLDAAPDKIAEQIQAVLKRCTTLKVKRDTVPKRIRVGELVQGAIVKPATERKHLTNLIKMVAYQAESGSGHARRAALQARRGRRPHAHSSCARLCG